jgi:hypothetical protein
MSESVDAQRRARRERHSLVAEIEALADGGAQRFLAVRAEARGERRRQLVGVAEAVAADEAVLGEELRIVEVGERWCRRSGIGSWLRNGTYT